MKKIILIIAAIIFMIDINKITYAEELRGNDAFMGFKINPSNSISYKVNIQTTKKYKNHTEAWSNAINKFENIENADIEFVNSPNYGQSQIKMTSAYSSKEEWVGLCEYRYYIGNDNELGILSSAENFLNDYTLKKNNLSKEHTYQVALHELGHSFGLQHQQQEYYSKSIMTPYVYSDIRASTDLKALDKKNISYAYKKETTDWKYHWAKNEIQKAMDNNWTDKTDNFRPEDSMTRAEFVKVFNRVFDLTTQNGHIFEDTKGHWAQDEIDIAITNGVANGISQTQFSPDAPITREQTAKMIANYLNISDKEHDKLLNYKDYGQISDWAKDEMEGILECGYMNGTPEKYLNPKNQIKRAEAIGMLARVK